MSDKNPHENHHLIIRIQQLQNNSFAKFLTMGVVNGKQIVLSQQAIQSGY